MFKKTRSFIQHHWLTIAFILGFIVDNLTLNRVDQVFDNVILFSYVLLAMLSILMLYAGIAERYSDRINHFLKTKSSFVMQYAFGGLLSGMLIFYGRSSSLLDSWPFLLIIIGVIYGNETITNRAGRLVYNLTIFFVGLFAYVVLVVPVILGKMGSLVFVGSGVLSIIIMYMFFSVLERVVPNFIELQKRKVVFSIGLFYVTLNCFYFTNIIPPIPLSLKQIGIYHSVTRTQGDYTLVFEKPKWWEVYRTTAQDFHYSTDEYIYCYSSVFAPSRLTTKIFHRWEYYDESTGAWKDYQRIPYSIQGGRGEGYRGYTLIDTYHEGLWRCTVETERGQVIGRERFVVTSGVKGKLVTTKQ